MKRSRAAWLVAAGIVLIGAPAVQGQMCTAGLPNGSCGRTTSTSITIGTIMQLTLSSSSTTLSVPSIADYDAGFVADNGPIATVKSNRLWKLQISATAATWTAANTELGVSARLGKPVGDLLWSTAPGGPFTALSTSGTDAVLGTPTSGAITNFFFRTTYDWTLDTPGNYSLTVVFTVINQ